jgi:thiamine-phosphate pyrophosphorylase
VGGATADFAAARGLYAIVDPEFCRGRDPLQVAELILSGGCAALQLRDKRASDAELEPLARAMRALCERHDVPFVVNDRPELALQVAAAGVHVGQTDMPVERVRALCGARLAIGVSTHDLAQARAAEVRGADLIGFGPIFATASKTDASPVVGLHGLHAACAAVRIPVVAIGGIAVHNARAVSAAGAPLAAAISALCSADSPRDAAAQLHAALAFP